MWKSASRGRETFASLGCVAMSSASSTVKSATRSAFAWKYGNAASVDVAGLR